MTRYREILRLWDQGISKSGIAKSCECSRNTVASVIGKAEEAGLECPLSDSLTDAKLHNMLFGERSAADHGRKEPDYDAIHRELAKSGVTLSLLWNEYCEACRLTGEIPVLQRIP